MNELEVSEEFIEENRQNLSQFVPKSRRRGPYSKQDKEARRVEVYRLHFDHGYSARKIADMMKINRNTINVDLNYWYSKIVENSNIIDPEYAILITLERLEIQYTRLREQIDKTDSQQEKNAIERLMLDVNSKIIHTNHRLAESSRRLLDFSIQSRNDWMKENRRKERFLTLFDTIKVSQTAQEKINRIIIEDRKRPELKI